MKRVLRCLFVITFLFTALIINAQESKKVVIAGKVSNPDADILYLKAAVNRIGFNECETKEVVLDNNGCFSISFYSYIPTDVWITYKANFLVMVHPGDSIYIEFDGFPKDRLDVLETVKIKGDNSDNNILAVLFQKVWFSKNHYSNMQKIYVGQKNLNELKYRNLCDSIYKNENYSLDSFILANNVSEEFKKWATNNIKLGYYTKLIQYPNRYRYFNKIEPKDWSVNPNYYTFFDPEFSLSSNDFISAYAIRSFINFYSSYYYELLLPKFSSLIGSNNEKDHHIIDSILVYGKIKMIEDSLLRSLVLTENFAQRLDISDIKNFEKHETIIQKYITQPYLKEYLYQQYNGIKESIKNPKVEVDDQLKKFEGYELKVVFEDIFAKNKDKVIYVDCWATWCSPCLGEMPNSKALMKEFKDKDVAFVFLCLDSQEDLWKSTINRLKLDGQHYFLNKKQSSELRRLYKIQGIPYYILYNKDGAISEHPTLRPNMMKDKINKLLNM